MNTRDEKRDGSEANENHTGKTAQGRTIGMPDSQKNADPARNNQTGMKQANQGNNLQWQQKVPAAQNEWNKLNEDELLQCNGDPQRLAGLVEKRYDVSHSEAESQVNKFLNK